MKQEEWEENFLQACSDVDVQVAQELLRKNFPLHLLTHENEVSIKIINEGFLEACYSGHLNMIKYLLFSLQIDFPSINERIDTNIYEDVGFREACSNGHLEVVKFLLTSPELKAEGHAWADIHADDDWGLNYACHHEKWNLVRWLIVDYEIKKTSRMEGLMSTYPQVQDYFKAQEENKALKKNNQDSQALKT